MIVAALVVALLAAVAGYAAAIRRATRCWQRSIPVNGRAAECNQAVTSHRSGVSDR